MSTWRIWIGRSVGMIAVLVWDLSIGQATPMHVLLQASVLAVIFSTAYYGFTAGFILAIIFGYIEGWFSAIAPLLHTASLVGAGFVTWLLLRKFLTRRSLGSLLLTTITATAGYYLTATTVLLLWHIFSSSILLPDWPSVLITGAWQLLWHPIWMYLVWLRRGGTQTATTITEIS